MVRVLTSQIRLQEIWRKPPNDNTVWQIHSRVFPLKELRVRWGGGWWGISISFSEINRRAWNPESHFEKYFPWSQETVGLFNQIKKQRFFFFSFPICHGLRSLPASGRNTAAILIFSEPLESSLRPHTPFSLHTCVYFWRTGYSLTQPRQLSDSRNVMLLQCFVVAVVCSTF